MAGRPDRTHAPLVSGPLPRGPSLIPCLLLKKGDVFLPAENGPEPARSSDGSAYDAFEVVDRLVADYPLVYLVDLDGIERAEPQLDFLQELAREATLWVDAGVRTAEQAIDILVTGARRAVLSSSTLRGLRELRRAWRLSSELAFEVELTSGGLVAAEEWATTDPLEMIRSVREVGPDHLIVSPREADPDWAFVAGVAAGGPTWVDGTFSANQVSQLRESGARGGIFHLNGILGPDVVPRDEPSQADDRPLRDDET